MERGCEGQIEKDIYSFLSVDDAIEYYYRHYKEHGYPNYSCSSYNPQKELERVRNADDVIQGDVAIQSMVGCGFLWSYFPHWVDVKTWNSESVADNWKDDAKLHKLIEKTVAWCIKHEHGRMSENRVRQLAKVYLAKQAPSNFRPTVAKSLYSRYGNGGAVYDPCAGWGGRMMGFLASTCVEYVCCEPSTKTVSGLVSLANTFQTEGKSVVINPVCQEDYTPAEEHFDMVFTSPPYYDCEKYCDEPTQSYIRYPTISKWSAGFLEPLVYNAWIALKQGGYFVLNIANTKTAPRLEELSVIYAQMMGFSLVDTIKLTLSSISGNGTKYEPMFVFKK